MGNRPYDTVCFDLDGTLIDTKPLHLQAERETLRAFDFRPSTAQLRAHESGLALREILGADLAAAL